MSLNREISQEPYFNKETKAFKLLKKYLEPYIAGLSCGNRDKDIIKLLEENNVVIAFDDYDLSHIIHSNYLFVELKGFVDGNVTYKVKQFIDKLS